MAEPVLHTRALSATQLASEILRPDAESLLNRYAIALSQSAAMAHLAVYGLVAMGSTQALPILKIVQALQVSWFSRRTKRKLDSLRQTWAPRSVPSPVGDLLANARRTLDGD